MADGDPQTTSAPTDVPPDSFANYITNLLQDGVLPVFKEGGYPLTVLVLGGTFMIMAYLVAPNALLGGGSPQEIPLGLRYFVLGFGAVLILAGGAWGFRDKQVSATATANLEKVRQELTTAQALILELSQQTQAKAGELAVAAQNEATSRGLGLESAALPAVQQNVQVQSVANAIQETFRRGTFDKLDQHVAELRAARR